MLFCQHLQDKMDQMKDSLFRKEYEDPFKGSK